MMTELIPEQKALQRDKKIGWLKLIIPFSVLIVAGILLPPAKPQTKPTVKEHDQLRREAYHLAKNYFESRLTNPATFESPDVADSIVDFDSSFLIISHFNSKNEQGKIDTNYFSVKLNFDWRLSVDSTKWKIGEVLLNGDALR